MIVRLSGGLGNQMFQYAFGRAMCHKHGEKLYLDTSAYARDRKRDFELQKYAIVRRKGGGLQSFWYNCIRFLEHRIGHGEKLAKKLHYFREAEVFRLYDFPHVKGYFDGCWQNEQYFESIAEELRQEFVYREMQLSQEQKDILASVECENSVAIHVRRGDYLDAEYQRIYSLPGKEYYREAINYMTRNVEEPHFYVFSDDIEWCKENFLDFGIHMTFIDGAINGNQNEDFAMMKSCKHFIIANSTFSWWAAWLAEYPKKEMVAPKVWFVNEKHQEAVQSALLGDFITM